MRKTILIVDDEAIVRESISNRLEQAGYQVVTAQSLEEALETIKEQALRIIVVDIAAAGETGLIPLRQIKAIRPQLRFVVMSAPAFASPEAAVKVMKLGAVDYLLKPVAPDHLERLIREVFLKYENLE